MKKLNYVNLVMDPKKDSALNKIKAENSINLVIGPVINS